MDVQKWIVELREQLEATQLAIRALERLSRTRVPIVKPEKQASATRILRTKAGEGVDVDPVASEDPQSWIDPNVAQAILEMSIDRPKYSNVRVANELRKRGLHVSRVDVRNVWVQHNLQTCAKRLRRTAFEAEFSQKL